MSCRILRMSRRYLPNEKQPPIQGFSNISEKKHFFVVLVSNESSKCQNNLYVGLCIDEDVCTRCTKRRCPGGFCLGLLGVAFRTVECFR